MIELAYPWALLAVFLPLAVYLLTPVYRERRDSIQVPYFQKLIELSGKQPSRGAIKLSRSRQQRALLLLGWLSLVVAIAKPEWVGEPIEQQRAAREIMVALDLSGSMSEEDFVGSDGQVSNRLEAAKQVLSSFAEQREHDRLGLILFGDAAYLQAPFTEDIQTWQTLLGQTALGVAGWQTALGDAIGLSINAFENEQTANRLLILLTDGYDTGSRIPPLKAAEVAQQFDIRIHTIAMGDPSSTGKYRLDTETLDEIARLTGGTSFRAINRQELQRVYQQINQMEPQLYDTLSFRPRTSLHHLPFALYIGLNLALLLPVIYRRLRARWHGADPAELLPQEASHD